MRKGNLEMEVMDKLLFKPRSLTKYYGGEKKVVIPEGICDISSNAGFSANKEMEELILPTTLFGVPEGIFADCDNLRTAEVWGSDIGKNVFKGCTNLEKVLIGSTVKNISEGAFSDCPLSEVHLPYLCEVADNAFAPEVRVFFDGGYDRPVERKEQETIEASNQVAFDGWQVANDDPHPFVVSVLNSDKDWDFCSGMELLPWEPDCGLKEHYVPKEDATPEMAFLADSMDANELYTCPCMQKGYDPDSCPEEERCSFDSLESLEKKRAACSFYNQNLEIQNGVLFDSVTGTTLDAVASMEEAHVPEGIKAIGYESFSFGCYSKVTLPSSLEHIGPGAFFGCDDLDKIAFPKGLKCICSSAFLRTKVKKVYVPKDCFISSNAFEDDVEIIRVDEGE